MSREQDYFPPSGTKYKWQPKALQHSGWSVVTWEHWPAAVRAYVDLIDGWYLWRVEVTDWRHKRLVIKGQAKDDLLACLQAESICEAEKKRLWLPWMKKAVEAGWRPPC